MRNKVFILTLGASLMSGCSGSGEPTTLEMKEAVVKADKFSKFYRIEGFESYGCESTKKPDVFKCDLEFKQVINGAEDKIKRGTYYFMINEKGEWKAVK